MRSIKAECTFAQSVSNLIEALLTTTFTFLADTMSYNEIKNEQSLQVNFQGFLDHLITILDSCRKGELFIALVQSNVSHVLQFYEKRSLKNLVHLFLRVQEAPPAVTMYHLNMTLNQLKEEIASLNNHNKCQQNEVNKRDFHVAELQSEIAKLKVRLNESENMILHRNTEEVKRLNQQIKDIDTTKEYEENRLKTLVRTYEAKVDHLTKENYKANDKLS